MHAVLGTAALWFGMIGTHLGLASRRPREALVARLGEQGYLTAFSLVAALAFTALVWFYAAHRTEGPAGLALGSVPWLRPLLVTLIVAGFALGAAFTGGFAVLGLVGSWHQDRKLLRLRGEPYAA